MNDVINLNGEINKLMPLPPRLVEFRPLNLQAIVRDLCL